MRSGRFTTVLLAVALAAVAPAVAQESAPAPEVQPAHSKIQSRPSSDVRLERLWFQRREALDVDDMVRAAGIIERMSEVIQAEHLDRVTWLARAFAFEGYGHLREGNYERAREAYDIARRFDPKLPEAQSGYAWAAFHAGHGFAGFVGEYRKSLALRWGSFVAQGKANLLLLGLIVLWGLSVVVVLVFVLRYHRMLRHDVGEWIPGSWSEGTSKLAGWVVLLAPLLAWIGGVWLILYWCVVLARYMSGSERLVAAAVCLVVLVTGPVAEMGAAEAQTSSDPMTLAIDDALAGGYGNAVISQLQRAIQSSPTSTGLRLLLATTYERAGLGREAFEAYQNLLKIRPDSAGALNNQGNLFLRNGQNGQAMALYAQAAEVRPDLAIVFHNLALAQFEALRLSDAESNLRHLQEMAPDLARRLVSARDQGQDVEPLRVYVTREEVWSELAAMAPRRAAGADLAEYLKTPSAMGAMAALLLLAWAGISRAPLKAQVCIRCGEPFCGRCKKELGAKECCAQCIHLFIKKNAIAPHARGEKLRQVERYASRWALKVRAASLLFPGAGHLVAGRTWAGILYALLWTAPLCYLLARNHLVLAPSLPVVDMPSLTTLLAAIVMAFAWIGSNLAVPRPAA